MQLCWQNLNLALLCFQQSAVPTTVLWASRSALQCLKCSFTVFDIPCHTSTVTCEEGQVCATIHGRAAGHKLIKKKNCVDQQKCNQNETASFLGVSYVTTFNCCEGDFCNSAATVPSAHLSLPMALAMLGVWLTRFL